MQGSQTANWTNPSAVAPSPTRTPINNFQHYHLTKVGILFGHLGYRQPEQCSEVCWEDDYQKLVHELQSRLNWQPFRSCRRNIKLKVAHNIVNNFLCIPSSSFANHSSPPPRHPHNKILFISTMSHRHSYFIDVIPHWNSLSHHQTLKLLCCTKFSRTIQAVTPTRSTVTLSIT